MGSASLTPSVRSWLLCTYSAGFSVTECLFLPNVKGFFTFTLCVLLGGVPLESFQHWSSTQGLVGHRTTKHDDGTICVGCACIGVGLCLSTTYVHSLLGYHVSVFDCIRVIRNVLMISLIVTLSIYIPPKRNTCTLYYVY